MQSKEELETFYSQPDPWNIQNNRHDIHRKNIIISVCELFGKKFNPIIGRFARALDIGCGEGWITSELPASVIHGLELSEQARSRIPCDVGRIVEPVGTYDLVTSFGTMYAQYDWQRFLSQMASHGTRIIVTCNIAEWEVEAFRSQTGMASFLFGKQIFSAEFPYREWTQKLRVFER